MLDISISVAGGKAWRENSTPLAKTDKRADTSRDHAGIKTSDGRARLEESAGPPEEPSRKVDGEEKVMALLGGEGLKLTCWGDDGGITPDLEGETDGGASTERSMGLAGELVGA